MLPERTEHAWAVLPERTGPTSHEASASLASVLVAHDVLPERTEHAWAVLPERTG